MHALMMTELFWTISLSLSLSLSISLLALLGSTQQEVKWAQFKGYSCVTRATECLSHTENANAFSPSRCMLIILLLNLCYVSVSQFYKKIT